MKSMAKIIQPDLRNIIWEGTVWQDVESEHSSKNKAELVIAR